jgi:serine/threonine protein kinase
VIGKTISHYKILEKLGGGGMGVVYKAEDLKLKRTVALKFLPSELTRDPEAKKRFIHEAQAASAHEHSNICNIHEIDETEEDQSFICMAYYKGETLKKRIEQGPLKLDNAIDTASQVGRGLAAAHEASVIHRDIKPANVMITEKEEVKIVDFGLAKLASQTKLTREGTSLGTVAYMSPEQARGEEVDKRTDIWSLGVMMYEMITAALPFKGDYGQAQVYAILNENPEPVTGLRSGVPMDLELIINKALSKSPDERYQHAEELVADLTRLKRERDSYKQILTKQPIRQRPPRKSIKRYIIPVAIALVMSIMLLLLRNQIFKGEIEPIPIAVINFENQTGDASYNYLRKAIPNRLFTNLEQS